MKKRDTDWLTDLETGKIAGLTAERLAAAGHRADTVSDERVLAKLGMVCAAVLPDDDVEPARVRVCTEEGVAAVRRAMRKTEGGGEAADAVRGASPDTGIAGAGGDARAPGGATPKVLMIAVGDLEPHPAALAFWPSTPEREEDKAAVMASVREHGVKRPLLVTPRAEGGYWVIDGCTRLSGALGAKVREVPCEIRDLPEVGVGDEIFIANMTRTRFTAGQRVMKYLERHEEAVLEASERNADPRAAGARGGRGNKGGTDDTPFTPEAVSGRLGVSKADVIGGIRLLKCRHDGLMPVARGAGAVDLVDADEDGREAVEAAYAAVTAGGSARNWHTGAAGRAATKDRVKAPVRHWSVAERGATMLCTAFEAWTNIDWPGPAKRAEVERRVAQMLALLPECGRAALIGLIPQAWSPAERAALAKAVEARRKAR